MRVPQVNERVKEVPAHALRAMFAGIGQLLSVADKLRSKSAQAPATAETAAKAPEARTANGAATAPEAATVTTPAPKTTAKTTPKTTAKSAEPEPKPEPKAATPDSAPAGGHVKVIPSEKEAPQAATAKATPAGELPLANYDSLTVSSLRARLRNLSVAQLGQLIAYEKAHAARADVIAMFERRVTKLESES
jgi:hypothetical protein